METSCQGSNIMWFFKDRGFNEKSIQEMSRKCKHLEGVDGERASENWDYLKSIGIQERKLPYVVGKCPKILTLDLQEKLVPMVQCLASLGTKPNEVASAITKFPHILLHRLEEKLCPLLAFFESLGAPEKQLGKMLLLNPRIVSYSIESKLSQTVDFLASLGLSKDGMIGKVLVKHPCIMGYSVEKRLRPSSEFLKSSGLTESQLQSVAINFPEVLCRDVDKIRPNVAYLISCGLDSRQIARIVAGHPPVLIKSVDNSLKPRVKFLKEVMGRELQEVVDYPDFFRHGLKKRLESRQKMLRRNHIIDCGLSEMLDCNHKKFLLKFGLAGQFV